MPFLFLICAEGLSYLFFADDSLLFTKANESNCNAIKTILAEYGKALGQVINLDKFAMCISLSFLNREGRLLAAKVIIKLVECHEKHLGLPCFTGRRKWKVFANIVD